MNIYRSSAVLTVLVAFAVIGCRSESPAESKPAAAKTAVAAEPSGGATITQAARDEANEIFNTRCTPCHGPTGGGDGPASAGLTPKPANFQNAEWQAGVTDDHIQKIIMYGGAAVGRSPMMPGNPDLASKEATVAALREFIRELQK